jgi:hypothetical protein
MEMPIPLKTLIFQIEAKLKQTRTAINCRPSAMIVSGLVTCRLTAASGAPSSAQTTSPWEAAAAGCADSPLIGPIGQILSCS